MRFDKQVFYFNEKKESLGWKLGNMNDLGAEKQKELFSAASTQANLKERHVVVVTDQPLPIRSGFLKINDQVFTILKVIGSTIYAGEYRGRL